MNNGEGMPRDSHIGESGPLGSSGIGWQGSQIDFEISGTGPWEATAWDEDMCVTAFKTNHRFVLLVRLWIWHFRFNRDHTNGGKDA